MTNPVNSLGDYACVLQFTCIPGLFSTPTQIKKPGDEARMDFATTLKLHCNNDEHFKVQPGISCEHDGLDHSVAVTTVTCTCSSWHERQSTCSSFEVPGFSQGANFLSSPHLGGRSLIPSPIVVDWTGLQVDPEDRPSMVSFTPTHKPLAPTSGKPSNIQVN